MCFLKQLPFSFCFPLFFLHFTAYSDFQPGSLLALDFRVSAFPVFLGNAPSPTPEQRIAKPVPAATASRLLRPPGGQVFHSSRLRCLLPSDALTLTPSWRSRERDRMFPGFAGSQHRQVDITLNLVLQPW